jgi:cytochrome P450
LPLTEPQNLESPIIRISPHELHVNDPDFYDVLFAGSHTKRDKPPTWSHAFSNIDSVFGTISHEKHRVRRSALNPLFSQSSLRKLEPLIQDKIDRLVSVFRRYQQTGEVLPMRAAFAALTSDIIADYCFGASENYIEAPGFNAVVLETTDSLTENMHITVQFQWLPRLMDSLPDKIVEGMLGEGMAKFNELKRVSVSASRSYVENLLTTIKPQHCIKRIKETMATVGDFRDVKHRTIFHELIASSTLPPEDKSVDRLWQEAQLLLAAGTVTTATSLSSALVFLLLDQDRLKVLLEELEVAMPDISKPTREADLQRLPYLVSITDR